MHIGDLTSIYLSKQEYNLLRKSNITYIRYSEKLDSLIKSDLITFAKYYFDDIGNQLPIKEKCKITDKGKAYLHYYKSNFVSEKLPIFISVVALIVSIFTSA